MDASSLPGGEAAHSSWLRVSRIRKPWAWRQARTSSRRLSKMPEQMTSPPGRRRRPREGRQSQNDAGYDVDQGQVKGASCVQQRRQSARISGHIAGEGAETGAAMPL